MTHPEGVFMTFCLFSLTVKSHWSLCNYLKSTVLKLTTVALLCQKENYKLYINYKQPPLTPTGSVCYTHSSSCVHILLMWSAIVLVDIHLSTSRTQNGLSLFTAVFHILGSRSPGFFLRSRVSCCGG